MKPTLTYPFDTPPEGASMLEVAPGVHWIRLPLPMDPGHINVWALDDGDGWTVIDTGMCSDATFSGWRALFADALGGRPVRRVLVTHMHPDHVGMAGWLTREFHCRLWMTQLEYLSCRVLMCETGRQAPANAIDFYRKAQWSDDAVARFQHRFGQVGEYIYRLPDSYRRIVDGEEIRIGQHHWRVIVGSGHSPEHASLYCAALKLLISGDQVLPEISSNISVHWSAPDANPMQCWLASLAKLRREVPDDVLVLPAHGSCFRHLHARLAYLASSQLRRLERLRAALADEHAAVQVFEVLFRRAIGARHVTLLMLATGESLACLNYLLQRGEISRRIDDRGVAWYRLA